MSMKFTLVNGGHRQGKKTYEVGDTVYSDRPLHTIFKNKFQLVEGGETKAPPAEVATSVPVGEKEVVRSKKSSVTYKKVKRGKNRYDVVNSKGKVMNEEFLSKTEAEELITAYSEE